MILAGAFLEDLSRFSFKDGVEMDLEREGAERARILVGRGVWGIR